jgi:hypothetical protein
VRVEIHSQPYAKYGSRWVDFHETHNHSIVMWISYTNEFHPNGRKRRQCGQNTYVPKDGTAFNAPMFTKLTTALWYYVEIPSTQFHQTRSRKGESMNIKLLHDCHRSDFQETLIFSTHPCKELYQISLKFDKRYYRGYRVTGSFSSFEGN